MKKGTDWHSYVNEQGDFELPTYLFNIINDLMKQSLDMGTLLSNDPAKTRAYKERIKGIFKGSWLSIAQALANFDLIVPCTCFGTTQFCELCGGSRYQLNTALSPDSLREISMVTDAADPVLAQKLQDGLIRALEEVDRM